MLSYFVINDEITQHKEIGLIFVMVFLFIAVLVTITTVHRLLNSQRLQIGILKSMGFHNRPLYIHYISHSTFVCLFGFGCRLVCRICNITKIVVSDFNGRNVYSSKIKVSNVGRKLVASHCLCVALFGYFSGCMSQKHKRECGEDIILK